MGSRFRGDDERGEGSLTDTDEPREPPRAVAHFFFLVLVGFMVIGSLALSARPPILASFLNVAPGRAAPAGVADPVDWSLTIHRSDWRPGVARLLGRIRTAPAPRLGWVVREWSFLGLPLFAIRQSDVSVYREDEVGYRLAGLTDAERQAVERAGGAGLFPFWRYVWGWIAVAAVALFAWAELRWQAWRRAILGIL